MVIFLVACTTDPLPTQDTGAPASLIVDDAISLEAGESTELAVTFAPTAPLRHDASLTMSQEASPLASVSLSGEGQQERLTASPGALDFGEVLVGLGECRRGGVA
ncbi:MAG: hypothetical protein ACI8S6_002569 [Myxococcota bacterium]|jgi:hypothetical protein